MSGKLFSPMAMFIHTAHGTAESGHGEYRYELATLLSGCPIIRSADTGVAWAISWKDLVGMAKAAGIDDEWKPLGATADAPPPTAAQVQQLADAACEADMAREFTIHPEWAAAIRQAVDQLHGVALAAEAEYGYQVYDHDDDEVA